MNTFRALELLEISDESYTPEILKKQYHVLAKKYHPDKNKDPKANEHFVKIQEAYTFLTDPSPEPTHVFQSTDIDLDFLFKAFNPFQFFQTQMNKPKTKNTNVMSVTLTPQEYYTGTMKTVRTRQNCNCEKTMCACCVGTGYNLTKTHNASLGVCMECLGNGYSECEQCYAMVSIVIAPKVQNTEIQHPLIGTIKISIEEPYYLYKNSLFCTFDITLKESLTGFQKTFKDPFDTIHTISVKKIVQTNDGYRLPGIDLTLVFRVVYPKKLSARTIEQLKGIDF
jgi:hypothetical protein